MNIDLIVCLLTAICIIGCYGQSEFGRPGFPSIPRRDILHNRNQNKTETLGIVALTLGLERVWKEVSKEHLFFFFKFYCVVIRDYFSFHYGRLRHMAVSCFHSSSFSRQSWCALFTVTDLCFFFFSVTIIIPVRPVASVVLVQWELSVSACCSHSFRFAAFPLKRTHAGLPYRAQSKSSSTGERNRSALKSGFTFEGFWSLLHGRWTPIKIDCTAIIITFFFFLEDQQLACIWA